MKNRITAVVLAAALSVFAAAPAIAWDGAVSGTISSIEQWKSGNYDVRVYLVGQGNNVCGAGTPNWVYMNETDPNFKPFVAALISAKIMKSTIFLYSTKVGIYCRLDSILWS